MPEHLSSDFALTSHAGHLSTELDSEERDKRFSIRFTQVSKQCQSLLQLQLALSRMHPRSSSIPSLMVLFMRRCALHSPSIMWLDDPFDNLAFPAVPSAQPGEFSVWRKPWFLARIYKSHTMDIQSDSSQLATAKLSTLSPKLPSSCIQTQTYLSKSKRNSRHHADPPNSKDLYQERNEDPELGSRGADHHGPYRHHPCFHQDWYWECPGKRGCLGSKCCKSQLQVSLRHTAFF